MRHAPCFKCDDRFMGCHITCDKYIKYRKEQEEIYKRREIEAECKRYEYDQKVENWKRRLKRNG